MNEYPHWVTPTIDRTGIISMKVACEAPSGSPCRMFCEEGCEAAEYGDQCDHNRVDVGYCCSTEGWFDDVHEVPDLYDGGLAELRRGPIAIEWDGDGVTWHYVEASHE